MKQRRFKSVNMVKKECGSLTAQFERVVPYVSTSFAAGGFVNEVRFEKKYEEYEQNAMKAFYHLNRFRLHADDVSLMQEAIKAFNPEVLEDVRKVPEKREGSVKRFCKALRAKLGF